MVSVTGIMNSVTNIICEYWKYEWNGLEMERAFIVSEAENFVSLIQKGGIDHFLM
jgi:hypothetical protein